MNTRNGWEHFKEGASFLSNISIIITLLPLFFALYFKQTGLYQFFQLYKAKIFNLQGYIVYGQTKTGPEPGAYWLLVSNREDNTSESIKEGDILQSAIDDTNALWQNHSYESRVLFYAQPYQCVIVIDNQKYDEPANLKKEKDWMKSDKARKWVKVALIPCPVDSPK